VFFFVFFFFLSSFPLPHFLPLLPPPSFVLSFYFSCFSPDITLLIPYSPSSPLSFLLLLFFFFSFFFPFLLFFYFLSSLTPLQPFLPPHYPPCRPHSSLLSLPEYYTRSCFSSFSLNVSFSLPLSFSGTYVSTHLFSFPSSFSSASLMVFRSAL